MVRRLLAIVSWVLAATILSCQPPAPALPCKAEGETLTWRVEGLQCCDGLTAVDAWLAPSDSYEGNDLPEGCGVNDKIMGLLLCIDCGDGMCSDSESFCTCPEDCDRPKE